MKFVRYQQRDAVRYGVLNGHDTLHPVTGDVFAKPVIGEEEVPLADVRLLPPTDASSMIALWNNSRSQIEKLNRATPEDVLYFLKPKSSVATHGDPIKYPVGKVSRVVLEGELGIVIGRTCKDITVAEAKDYIFGYTVVNDITAQDIVGKDKTFPQYTRGKGYDTFSIYGPAVATDVDPMTLRIQSFINGRKCQDYPVTDLVYGPYDIVAMLSQSMTLVPGDIIACGTSLGVEPITEGDLVEIRIDGVGTLANRVHF